MVTIALLFILPLNYLEKIVDTLLNYPAVLIAIACAGLFFMTGLLTGA